MIISAIALIGLVIIVDIKEKIPSNVLDPVLWISAGLSGGGGAIGVSLLAYQVVKEDKEKDQPPAKTA